MIRSNSTPSRSLLAANESRSTLERMISLNRSLEPGEGVRRVGERRPRPDGPAERRPLLLGRRDAERARRSGRASSPARRGSASSGARARPRSPTARTRRAARPVGAVRSWAAAHRPSSADSPRLPVDQRAVAVEAEGPEPVELTHLRNSCRKTTKSVAWHQELRKCDTSRRHHRERSGLGAADAPRRASQRGTDRDEHDHRRRGDAVRGGPAGVLVQHAGDAAP